MNSVLPPRASNFGLQGSDQRDPSSPTGLGGNLKVTTEIKQSFSDIDEKKIKNTIRNIQWLQKELNLSPITNLHQRFKTVDIKNLSNEFKENFFDGIITEPELGPFYKQKPYYTDGKELIETKLQPGASGSQQ